jgi:hypothetical protein
MLTGDRVLSPFGQNMASSAEKSAQEIGKGVIASNEAKSLSEWRKAQLAKQDDDLTERIRHNKQDERIAAQRLTEGNSAAAAARAEAAAVAAAARVDAADERGAQALGTKLTSNKIPQVGASISMVNDLMGKFLSPKEKGGAGMAELPGMGYAKNLPLASMFLSDEGKDMKSAVQRVSNDLLAMYSGLAVTVPESERRALEQMSDGKFSADDFKRGWPSMVARYNAVKNGLIGGFNPKVKQKYTENGGTDLSDIQAFGTEQPNESNSASDQIPASDPKQMAFSKFGMAKLSLAESRLKKNPEALPEFVEKFGYNPFDYVEAQ